MQFKSMEWMGDGGNPYQVVQVTFDHDDIAQAESIATKKIHFVNVNSPAGTPRTANVIKSRLVAGKLADASVRNFLQAKIIQSGKSYQIQEYDLIRQDRFKEPDPFDLCLKRPGESNSPIEVRSSFCYLLTSATEIAKKLSIYGWYTSYSKPIEEPKLWYWQVIFYLRPSDILSSNSNERVPIFEEQISSRCVTAYIVGGATKELLESSIASTRRDQDGAFYRAIHPICNGIDPYTLASMMTT